MVGGAANVELTAAPDPLFTALPVRQPARRRRRPRGIELLLERLDIRLHQLAELRNLRGQFVGGDLVLLRRRLGRPARRSASRRRRLAQMLRDGSRRRSVSRRQMRSPVSAVLISPRFFCSRRVSSRSLVGRLGVASIARRIADSRAPASVAVPAWPSWPFAASRACPETPRGRCGLPASKDLPPPLRMPAIRPAA